MALNLFRKKSPEPLMAEAAAPERQLKRALFIWLAIGLSIYFAYSVRHSKLRRGVDTGITEDIPPLIKT